MRKKTILRALSWLLLAALALSVGAVPAAATAVNDDGNEVVVIVLDPGHGGTDPGAVAEYDGVTVCERDLCWKMACYCKEYLEENYWNVQVLLTRQEDTAPALVDRVNYARDMGADFFLSFHLDAVESGSANGASALVPRGRYRPEQAAPSKAAADAILGYLEELGLYNRGQMILLTETNTYPDGSYWDAYDIVRYCVNRNIPGIILEQAFIDSEWDYENFLSSDEKLRQMGVANALGLAEILELEDIAMDPGGDGGETPEDPENPDDGFPFEDVPGDDWYHDAVAWAWEQGLMEGVSQTEFAPAMTANRAMVVTLLYRMDGSGEQADTVTFTDVPPDVFYYDPVEWAVKNGITNGVSPTQFAPGQEVIREQFVTFLYRYARLLGYDMTADALDGFTDGDVVSAYARDAMGWALRSGIIQGYDDGSLKPHRALNRAELATMIRRFDEYLQTAEKPAEIWTISHTDVTIKVGESFRLRLKNGNGDVADVDWQASKSGYVTIDGNKITGKAKGTITVSCQWQGETYKCIVRVKSA